MNESEFAAEVERYNTEKKRISLFSPLTDVDDITIRDFDMFSVILVTFIYLK